MTTPPPPEKFDQWVILEIMGHQRYAGRLTEETIAGHGFLRIDIPKSKGIEAFSKVFSPASVYAITPTTEQIAREMSSRLRQEPLSLYDFSVEFKQRLIGTVQARQIEQEEDDDQEAF